MLNRILNRIKRFWALRRGKVKITVLGYNLKFRTESNFEYYRVRTFNAEPEVLKYLKDFLTAGDIFYDIGANIGTYSVLASKLVGKKGRVYAFEPEVKNFHHLCSNKFFNNSNNLIPLCLAISNENRLSHFKLDSQEVGRGGHCLSESGEFTIPCFSLDSLQQNLKIPRPNHIKIDIEGQEEKALEGMKSILQSPELKTIIIEAHYTKPELEGNVELSPEEKRKKIERIDSFLRKYNFLSQALREERDYAHILYKGNITNISQT